METHADEKTLVSPVNPKPVKDMAGSMQSNSYSRTVDFVVGAAGFTGVASLKAPILNLDGSKTGSHWLKNPVWGHRAVVKSVKVTETAGSAEVQVYDSSNDLEHLFEGVGTARFLIRLTTEDGNEIYGYIGGVAESSDTYTFDIYDTAALGTQDWIGTLPAGGSIRKVEIFSNQTSLVWTTGTVLTNEVPWNFVASEEKNVMDLFASMSKGDYAVDYTNGKIYYKKATTGTSDIASYNINAEQDTEVLAELTNIAQSTTGYLYFDMAGFKYFALQLETSDAAPTDTLTLTLEATCQDDGTAKESCTYQDITNLYFGVVSVVDQDVLWEADTPSLFKYVRVKYVTSGGGGNDADLTAYVKKSN